MTDSIAAEPSVGADFVKPRLRGVFHQYAFFLSLACAIVLIAKSASGISRFAAALYAATVCGLFGISALYHRGSWSPAKRRIMRRLDHSMIFLLIAGTYTPFALLILSGPVATVVLVIVWAGAVAGIVMKVLWIDAPRWAGAGIYVALGWVSIAAIPQLVQRLGPVAAALLFCGGALYTVGAIIYARRRPDPNPKTFGYHEIFHLFVIAAAAFHYCVVAFFVL